MKNIFILVGERSADLHTSEFIKAIKKSDFDYTFWGIGGPKMQNLGFEPIFPFEKFSVIGFAEIIKHLKFFSEVIKKIRTELIKREPDLVILVDYPGLNIKIAKIAKTLQIPVLYYISPQVWAWKKKRIHKIKKYTDKIAVIFPFEKKLYEKIGANVEFIGHPVSEEVKIQFTKEEFAQKYKLDKGKKWLAFLPGSRDIEIEKILPEMIETIKKLQSQNNFEFLISRADSVSHKHFSELIESQKSKLHIVEEIYDLIKYSNLVICKSGTSALETGFIGTPMIVVYKTSFLSYFIAKLLIKIEMISMPNIILKKKVVPELIQKNANSDKITAEINLLLNDEKKYQKMKQELLVLREKLGSKKTSKNLARIVNSMSYETENKE